MKALRKKKSDCEIHGESRAAGNSPGSNYHSPQEIKYTAKSLSVAQTRRSARGLEADKYVRTNSGLLLGRDRDLETQAIATSMKIKGQQAGDKVLFSSKQRAAKMFMSGIFFSSFGQAELGCSRAAQDLTHTQGPKQSAKMGTCLGQLCKHNLCTQTVKYIQDLEFLLWHLVMSFNETTGNEVVFFFSLV